MVLGCSVALERRCPFMGEADFGTVNNLHEASETGDLSIYPVV